MVQPPERVRCPLFAPQKLLPVELHDLRPVYTDEVVPDRVEYLTPADTALYQTLWKPPPVPNLDEEK